MRMPGMARRTILVTLVVVLIGGGVLGAIGCSGEQTTAEKEAQTQQETLSLAINTVPPYEPAYFQSRMSINRYMEHVDTPQTQWFAYLVSDMGTFFGYFIFDAYPLSIGVGMTNPMQINDKNSLAYPAPGIDGVYWAGADPSVHYSFDALSGAMLQWNVNYIISDQPLNIDAPLLGVIIED